MKSLEDILCGEPWVWDSNGSCQISFKSNNTGELICRSETSLFIAAEFDWELTPGSTAASPTASPTTSPTLAAISLDPECATTLVTLSLEITLTKRLVPHFENTIWGSKGRLNGDLLNDSAFRPKTYRVRLERGDFVPTADAKAYESAGCALPGHTPRYRLKLVFDPSPYPPAGDWRDPHAGPVSFRVWDFNEFCADARGTVADRDQGGWMGRLFGAFREKA
ncbi:hypothetical protein F5X97DRAFT_287967 [Nemania serpens]|nr:hypothetical protein F5X97DRAFT_287967 [Nemania serpens]